ncbi:MAG TPA: hypothetical protein VM165_15940 [Planctomycetaceae bacterium]|nr:hypothetical protein [Planctomycetaceae bacterium]
MRAIGLVIVAVNVLIASNGHVHARDRIAPQAAAAKAPSAGAARSRPGSVIGQTYAVTINGGPAEDWTFKEDGTVPQTLGVTWRQIGVLVSLKGLWAAETECIDYMGIPICTTVTIDLRAECLAVGNSLIGAGLAAVEQDGSRLFAFPVLVVGKAP